MLKSPLIKIQKIFYALALMALSSQIIWAIHITEGVILNTRLLELAADTPVVVSMEVSQTEVGPDQTVRLMITADLEGYSAGPGTVINGIPITSERVKLIEQGGGQYILSYTVEEGDNDVPAGQLSTSVILTDTVGNISIAYTEIADNSLEIYTQRPTATLSYNYVRCQGDKAEFEVTLTGREPWEFGLYGGKTLHLYQGIDLSPYTFTVTLDSTTTYRIDSIWDRNSVVGLGSIGDTIKVIKNMADLEILNLDRVFNPTEPGVLLEGSPFGGVFSGPGIAGGTFYPAIAGTENSPHTISYTYTNEQGCTSVTSVTVYVSTVKEGIFMPDSVFCTDGEAFTVIGSNPAGATGSFTLENLAGQLIDGLTDYGNDTAEIAPAVLNLGKYTIVYKYFTNDTLYIRDTFSIEAGDIPVFEDPRNYYCEDEFQIDLKSNIENAEFSGTGVRGNVSDGFKFYTDSADQGSVIIVCTATSSNGCIASAEKQVTIKPKIQLGTTGYSEAFNVSDGMWTIHSENQKRSWVWDIPDFEDYTAEPGDKAWFTRLPDGTGGYEEDSWMQSPCFDLSEMERPFIRFDIMRSFLPQNNGAVLQYWDRLEEGWKTVGAETPGIGWYNLANIENKPGGSSVGWGLESENYDSGWMRASHDLDSLIGISNLSFRIAIATKGSKGSNQGFAFDNVSIAERSRLSVIEHFTNAADVASLASDKVVDEIGSKHSGDVIDIQYHMNYPGEDPMNTNNPDPAAIRGFTCGVPSVPYAIIDGGFNDEFKYNFADSTSTPQSDQIKVLSLKKPEFDVLLGVDWQENSMEATTTVTCNIDSSSENLQLYLVMIESSVNAYTGINGDTVFRNVVLDMLPSPNGTLLNENWTKGSYDIQLNSWDYPSYVEDVDDLAAVAFVQSKSTKQILQAAVNSKTSIFSDNLKPVVSLEDTVISVEVNESFTVKVNADDDGIPTPLTYQWAVIQGKVSSVQFENSDLAETSVTISETGSYALLVSVSDGEHTISLRIRVLVVEEASAVGLSPAKTVKIYPNPAASQLIIEVPDITGRASLKVYDILGAVHYMTEQLDPLNVIGLTDLEPGIYFLELKMNSVSWYNRFQVVR